MQNLIRELFLLDPEIIFLNHGSFGACPKPVFEIYQSWQRRLERQPVKFLGREIRELDCTARQALASFLHTRAENLAFVPNATHGVNIIARSLGLEPGDEILTSDHEYGACDHTWEFIAQKTGARVVRQHIPLPGALATTGIQGTPEADITELIWQGVTPRTRLIFLSHITSPTAMRLPVEVICALARAAGIRTLIDGAHAPGQIPLDLEAVGADWYTGNCHKWMLAPKGSGFLYARPEVQSLVEPLVVSWGYHAAPETTSGSQFLDYMVWTGTGDPAAYLTVPAAIQFMQEHAWETVRLDCHHLLRETIGEICALTDIQPAYPLDSDLYFQMGTAPLPAGINPTDLKNRLYDEYRIEVPITEWNGQKFLRISIQAYNTPADTAALLEALQELLVK
ncbi:MAG TPA: aminotransferase class V-fold PLP-dependent enzyme [Anaerolineales bacterium]|nr:aminotransferase class V-fold PLP-dependent enzyme [Anaerolineales bacterium]